MGNQEIVKLIEESLPNDIVVFVVANRIFIATTNEDYSNGNYKKTNNYDPALNLRFYDVRANCHKNVAKKDITYIIDGTFIQSLGTDGISWGIEDVYRIAMDNDIVVGVGEAQDILSGLQLEDFNQYAGMSDDLILNAIKQTL